MRFDPQSRPAVALLRDHRLYDPQLLIILLAEDGDRGSDQIKQASDDLADAGEVAWAMRILQAGRCRYLRQRRYGYILIGRIDRLDIGHEGYINSDGGRGVEVGVKRSRVVLVILARAELGGVDEDADDHVASQLPRPAYQGEMTIVQGPQQGHEGPAGKRGQLSRIAHDSHVCSVSQ